MVEIRSTNICSIEMFPLLWRWKQSSYTVISDEDIGSIEPLVESKSQELLNNLALENELVFVSWHKNIAVRMLLSLFIKQWSDFCYRSSDDVLIIPVSGRWLLKYAHYEIFTWSELNAI